MDMTRHVLLGWYGGFPQSVIHLYPNLKLCKYLVMELMRHSLEHRFL